MQEDAQADGSPAGPRRRSSTNNHMTSEASPDASNSGAGDPASSPQSQTAWTPAAAGTSPVPYPRSLPLPRPLSPATAARALHEAFLEVDGHLGEEERLEQLRALANTEAGAGQDAGSAGTARPAAASQAYGRWATGPRGSTCEPGACWLFQVHYGPDVVRTLLILSLAAAAIGVAGAAPAGPSWAPPPVPPPPWRWWGRTA